MNASFASLSHAQNPVDNMENGLGAGNSSQKKTIKIAKGKKGNRIKNFGNKKNREYVPPEVPIKPKDYEKKYQSYIEFINSGMLEKKIHLKIAKYYNVGGLIRLLSFEPFLVSC
jgi:hypothetical protein